MQIPALEGRPPRFYQLAIQRDLINGWSLVREWGQEGSSGRVKKDHFTDWDRAVDAMLRIRDTQLQRGYKVVFMQGQESPHE